MVVIKEKNECIKSLQLTYESLLREKESIINSLKSEIDSLNSQLINGTKEGSYIQLSVSNNYCTISLKVKI